MSYPRGHLDGIIRTRWLQDGHGDAYIYIYIYIERRWCLHCLVFEWPAKLFHAGCMNYSFSVLTTSGVLCLYFILVVYAGSEEWDMDCTGEFRCSTRGCS